MPRYEADPSKVSASLEVFPKGEYEFIIGEPKAFYAPGKEKGPNWGIRFALTCVSDTNNMKGKKYIQTLYLHSEAAAPMVKRWQLAASGYKADKVSEAAYNAAVAGLDWSYDTDSGAVGDAWRTFTGKRIIGDFDVKLGTNDEEQQDVKGWRPL